jgi:hypothetical protein
MKKGLILLLIILVCFAAASLITVAPGDTECEYDKEFDNDKDYIMNSDADCSDDYQYDCDDDDKDVFKECENSLWNRLVAWLKSKSEQKRQSAIITSNAVKQIIPDEDTFKTIKEKVTREKETIEQPECSAVICLDESFNEIYCPDDYDTCCGKFSECRIVECAQEYCVDDTPAYEEEYTYETDDSECQEEYNDCYDNGEAVICKGSFDACSSSFDDCTCGTSDDTGYDQAQPDFDASAPVDCATGVFVCERQVITMSGDIADSTVTCKSGFQECSMMYGNCKCGESDLIDFPTQYIGSAGIDDGGESENADSYWCDFKDKKVPCYMLPEGCTKKKNTCDKGNGIWITCDGSFEFCNKKYNGECLCGVEITSSGFMVTSAD